MADTQFGEDIDEGVIIDNTPAKNPRTADDEALESLYNRFNTANDNFTLYVERAIPNNKKTTNCFNCAIDGDFDSVVEQCRSEWIPIGEQQAEFIFRVMDKSGNWAVGGNKRMIISHKNSDMRRMANTAPNSSNTEINQILSDALNKQGEMFERFLTTDKKEEKPSALVEFMQSEGFKLLVPLVIPPMMTRLMAPASTPQSTGMKEALETVALIKEQFLPSEEKEEKEDSIMGIVNNVVKGFAGPIGEGVLALQKKAALPGPATPTNQIDEEIAVENEKRAALSDQSSSAIGDPQVFWSMIVNLTLNGWKNGATPDVYSCVILDQIPDENMDDFLTVLNSDQIYPAVCNINEACKDEAFHIWFNKLAIQINADMQEETEDSDENLTHKPESDIVNAEILTDSANESSDSDSITSAAPRPDGDNGDSASNEGVCQTEL